MLIGVLAQYFFGFTIFVLSSFLVLLVLVQRGRGGGLTGALGGPGGQSAFGTKAGDLFTRITVGVAAAWIILCATAVFMLRNRALPQTGGSDRPVAKGNATTGPGASSATTDTSENGSSLPNVDLLNLTPKSGLPDLKPSGSSVPNENATKPAAADANTPTAPAVAPPTTDAAPAAGTTPAEPALTPEKTPEKSPESTPDASTSTGTPPAPK